MVMILWWADLGERGIKSGWLGTGVGSWREANHIEVIPLVELAITPLPSPPAPLPAP